MASFLTNDQKNSYSEVFNHIHDTFSREIKYWKIPKKVILSSTPEYNFLYDNQEAVKYATIAESGVFRGRVLWGDPSITMANNSIKEEIPGNMCRLKVPVNSLEIFDNIDQIEIDGKIVQRVGSSRPHGLFNIDFHTLFFKESN